MADKIHSVIMSSLAEGKVPIAWKRADIVPLFKGGNKEDPLNYRSLSLINVVAKIYERLIEDRWMKHLEESKVLTDRQGRKILCYQFDKLLFKRDRHCARKRQLSGLYLLRSKEGIR